MAKIIPIRSPKLLLNELPPIVSEVWDIIEKQSQLRQMFPHAKFQIYGNTDKH